MAQGQVYDPLTKRTLTIEEAQQIMRERGGSMTGTGEGLDAAKVGFQNPLVDDQFVGVDLGSKAMAGKVGSEAARALPQIAGMAAQFTPVGKTYKGAMVVPALVDMVMQLIQTGTVDPTQVGVNAGMGAFAKGVGNTVAGVGKIGDAKILKSLSIPANEATDAGIEMFPKLAKREGARLTKESEAAIRAKGQATGAGGLEELADYMGKSRRADAVGPSRDSAWLNEALMNIVRNPRRQMRVGQALANPFGVDTGKVVAPTAEASTRALMALLASQGGAGEEPPMETSRGPRRRSQGQ